MEHTNLARCLILLYFSIVKQKNTNMLQSKDITKIQEIKALFMDSWVQQVFFQNK